MIISLLILLAVGVMWWDLSKGQGIIMATQAEVAAELRTANTQLKKLITDTAGIQPAVDALKAQIVVLEALVAAGGAVTQELVDAVAETKQLTQTVDDNVPELATPPVEPPPVDPPA